MRRASINSQFQISPAAATFDDLTVNLDDSRLSGNFVVTRFDDTRSMTARDEQQWTVVGGDLVDEQALRAALENGEIAGAGLDVLSVEPPPADHPLIQLAQEQPKKLIITPHSAWTSTEARSRLLDGMVQNIRNWQNGKPTNVVN